MAVAKVTSQFFILLKQASVQYQRVQQYLVNLRRDIGYEVQGVREALHARKYYSPELRSGCAAVIAVMNKGIEKLRPHLSGLREAAAVIGQRAQQNLVKSGIAAGHKARQVGTAVHARKYYLPELRTGGAAAISAANSGIKKVGSQLYVPLEHGAKHLQRAGAMVRSVRREIADQPRRIREARHTRENELRNLLVTSVDAIVVTDDEHRLVAANTNARELFGVSEANIRNFTLDSFISKGQIPGFNALGASFGSAGVKKGNCQIRRLNGTLRLADYEFTANHLPFRHLCIFRNITCKTIRPIGRTDTRAGSDLGRSVAMGNF
jgi:PAS domain-containing protein